MSRVSEISHSVAWLVVASLVAIGCRSHDSADRDVPSAARNTRVLEPLDEAHAAAFREAFDAAAGRPRYIVAVSPT